MMHDSTETGDIYAGDKCYREQYWGELLTLEFYVEFYAEKLYTYFTYFRCA